MSSARHSDWSLILLLATSSAVATMATNLFLPALPEIRAHFNASVAAAQTMLSVYLVAFACSILAVGPLSDRIGRRPLMIGGLVVFACGSLLAVFAPSLFILVLGRVVQAAGASAVIVLARAVVGDLYEGAELARRMAMLTMVIVGVTTASPYVGGHIISIGGWHAAFWVQGMVATVSAVACWRLLPETRRKEHMSASLLLMLQSGRALLSKPAFAIYVLQSAVILTIFMVFVSVTPYIMADALQRPGTEFGLYFMLIAGGYFLGNMQVSKRSHGVNVDRTTSLGLWLQLVATAVALIFVAAGLKHPLWMFGPMLPMAFGQGLAMPHLTARAVEMAPGNVGVAASLLGFSQQALSAASVQLMGWARTDTAVPLLLFCTGAAVVALIPVLAEQSWRSVRGEQQQAARTTRDP